MASTFGPVARRGLRLFLLIFALPLLTHAAWWMSRPHAATWNSANWRSAGLLPAPAAHPDASVHVFCARTGRWRGVFAHHCWIVVKPEGAAGYERYDKVGWGSPVRRNNWAADARWFGNPPETVAQLSGAAAAALIPRILAAVESYPFRQPGGYTLWPGPNSNSFVAHVVAAIPEARIVLPPTALGKDFRGTGLFAGSSISGAGVHVSLFGLVGLSLDRHSGLEMSLFGLIAGIDPAGLALLLPGWGRIGF